MLLGDQVNSVRIVGSSVLIVKTEVIEFTGEQGNFMTLVKQTNHDFSIDRQRHFETPKLTRIPLGSTISILR